MLNMMTMVDVEPFSFPYPYRAIITRDLCAHARCSGCYVHVTFHIKWWTLGMGQIMLNYSYSISTGFNELVLENESE